MCCRDEPVPHTTSQWVSKLPPRSFLSSQFAHGLGDWAALWGGDPILQRRWVVVLESCCPLLPCPEGRPGRSRQGTVCSK